MQIILVEQEKLCHLKTNRKKQSPLGAKFKTNLAANKQFVFITTRVHPDKQTTTHLYCISIYTHLSLNTAERY